jgi:hypothetical protein
MRFVLLVIRLVEMLAGLLARLVALSPRYGSVFRIARRVAQSTRIYAEPEFVAVVAKQFAGSTTTKGYVCPNNSRM